ncbi:hypothetical protein NDU88_003687, partial [Pleurodeles waltl]
MDPTQLQGIGEEAEQNSFAPSNPGDGPPAVERQQFWLEGLLRTDDWHTWWVWLSRGGGPEEGNQEAGDGATLWTWAGCMTRAEGPCVALRPSLG